VAETIKAEGILRDASMLRRKEKFRDAEAKAREAIALTPSDAAALELLGDILQGVGKVDEALAAYKRATEADAKRSSAERKYGDLLMRQQNWNFGDPEAAPPNRWLNSILSLCLPGVGQAINGDWVKAICFFALDLVCAFLLFYSPWAVAQKGSHAGPITLASFALTIVTYIVSFIDSNISAARKLTS
jgi:tetratricopeptide (TPR) repeat protein